LLISLVVGFHPLFLPTFIAEFIPGIGMLPTWTGCVLVVLMLRWKAQREQFTAPPPRVPPSQSDVIDV
ncbi:MAG: hypothetical protein H7Y43_07885, partial [Akkermansiaceae bacterium]|nr:hypothetical protein [Verrucomicrobiales bacterium]